MYHPVALATCGDKPDMPKTNPFHHIHMPYSLQLATAEEQKSGTTQ